MVRRQPEEMSSHQPIEMMDKGVPKAHENWFSHGWGSSLFFSQKCNFPYTSHSFWLNRHLFLQIPDRQKKIQSKWVTEPVGRKIPSRNSGLGFLWCHRICLGIWMTTSVLVKNEQFAKPASKWWIRMNRGSISLAKKNNSGGKVNNLLKQLLVETFSALCDRSPL